MAAHTAINRSGQRLADEVVEGLKSSFRGEIISSEDAGYDETRRVWNGNIDRYPGLVARCTGVADVLAAVNFARENDVLVSVRGGAHNAAGHGTCDGGIVIDLTSMKGVRVEPEARVAHVQPGVTWAELDHETQAFGLATPGGTVSNTGVAGLTLGGGIGWLMGSYGLSCDNLLSADVVTADGQLLHANATENADLYWALRGGGGNFGIVTSFQFQLHPIEALVLGGLVLHPLERAKEVLSFYRDFLRTLPDEAYAAAVLLTSPDGIPMVGLILIHNGKVEDGEKIFEPARKFGPPVADMVGPMPYAVRQQMLDPGFAQHGWQRYWKSGFVNEISDELIDVMVSAAKEFSSPLSALVFFPLHGAATRVAPDATAFSVRRPVFDTNAIAQWTDPSESERHISWIRALWDRIEPFTAGNAYVNHIAADDKPEKVRASYGSNYDRLAQIKAIYDPANLFQLNPNVKPA